MLLTKGVLRQTLKLPSLRGCEDFLVDPLEGIFRVSGLHDPDELFDAIYDCREFLYLLSLPSYGYLEANLDSDRLEKGEGDWSWTEWSHPTLPEQYRLGFDAPNFDYVETYKFLPESREWTEVEKDYDRLASQAHFGIELQLAVEGDSPATICYFYPRFWN